MKVRQGFVSNSSSSSFIVAFPRGMEINETSVHEYLYGKNPITLSSYGDGISSTDATAAIVRAMKDQVPNNQKELDDALGGYLEDAPAYYDIVTADRDDTELREQQWKEYRALGDAHRSKTLNAITKEWGDVDLYVFTFSDNDGHFWSTMEHGPTFDNVRHKRISNH